jgi:hypothetical protein
LENVQKNENCKGNNAPLNKIKDHKQKLDEANFYGINCMNTLKGINLHGRENMHTTHTTGSKLKGEEKEYEASGHYETPWKDNRSRRVSKIDEAAVFCAKLNFNRPSNSPSFA